jgi:hypothetical protein
MLGVRCAATVAGKHDFVTAGQRLGDQFGSLTDVIQKRAVD